MMRDLRRASLALAVLAVAVPVAHADTGPLSRYAPPSDPGLLERIARADPEAGAKTFDRRCSTCHDIEKGGKPSKGPPLWNVAGRKAGAVAGFAYSDAMRKSGHTWTLAALDYYLADTERAVPGRSMDFTGIADVKVRSDLVAYLRTMSDAPPPLR